MSVGTVNAVRLSIYGVGVAVESDEATVLEELRRDFEYFVDADTGKAPDVRWLARARPAPGELRGDDAGRRLRDYACLDRGSERRVFYDDGAVAVYDYAARAGTIHCADRERLHELAYLAILSRAGEELDLRGLHRAHALGFERDGAAGLLLLPSGGGKSSLALAMLRGTDFRILSEDTPIVSPELRVLPFPLRMGFRAADPLEGVPERWIRPFPRKRYGPKKLVDLGFFRDRLAQGAPARWLLIGERRPGARPHLEPVGRARALCALGVHFVVGYGVAQMSEYMLRPGATGLLARIAFSRARSALGLAGRAGCHRFCLGDDPKENVAVLRAYLDRCAG